ncbi:MAG: Crp/Fnr family transcriptional regulator [Bacteroidota bacterium]
MKNYFKAFDFLPEHEVEKLLKLASIRKLNKFDFFVTEGHTCNEVAFLVSGTFRSFYVPDKGEEITYCIMFPNNFITAYTSFITEQPSQENIQAITPAELLILTKKDIDALAKDHIQWMQFLKIMAEGQYLELEKRIFQLQRDSAIQRYTALLKDHPQYIQQVPLQYLASYLGISQRHLSRIRKGIIF